MVNAGRPAYRYRPTKTVDGNHGFTIALGTPITVFVGWQLEAAEIAGALVDAAEDILVGDILADHTNMTQYRVVSSLEPVESQYRTLRVERVARPIRIT